MANGLDIGSTALRAATSARDDTRVGGEPAVALRLPADVDASTDLADLLDGPTGDDDTADDGDFDGAPRVVTVDGDDYLVGSAAVRAASVVDADAEPLFERGVLARTPVAPVAFETVVEDLLAHAMGNRLCYTTPGSLLDADEPTDYHRERVDDRLSSLGYEATPVSRGFAVVYDQLGDDNYTGLGVCIGREVTSVALAFYGVPVLAFSLAKGGEWVIDRAAGDTGHAPGQVASVFADFALDPESDVGGIESALARAFDALAEELIAAVVDEAVDAEIERGMAVPVAVAGESAVDGVEFLLGGRFDAADLPFSIRGVRLADDPASSAARGALAAARDDVDAYADVTWSAGSTTADTSSDDGAETGSDATGVDALPDSAPGPLSVDQPGGDPADEAIEALFDRLGAREDRLAELGDGLATLSADLDALAAAHDALDDRAADADRVAALDDRLEGVTNDLGERFDGLATDLEARIDDLDAAIEDATDALDDRATVADLAAVEEALDVTDEEVDDLESALGDVRGDLDGVEETLADLRAYVDGLDDTLTGTQEGLETVVADVEENETRLDTVAADVEGNEEAIASLESEVASTEGTLGALATDVESNDAAIETVEADVAAATESVEIVETDVAAATESVESVESTVDDVESVESTVDDVESALETVQSTVAELNSLADDAAAERQAVDERVEDLEAGVGRLDDLEAAVADLGGEVDRLSEVESTLDERAVSAESAVGDRLDAVESTVASLGDEVRALRRDVAAVEGDESDGATGPDTGPDGTPSSPRASAAAGSAGAGATVVPLLAGGGGAGVVAGGSLTAAGDVGLGAGIALLGLVFVASAVVGARR